MAVDVKRVLREKPGSFLSYFLPLLVMAEDNVELIDCLELFGLDRLAEALELLGGSRIVFPTWATIDPLVKDAYLVTRLESLFGEPNAETRARFEAEFEAPYDLLLFRARSVKRLIRRAGIVRRGGKLQSVPVPGEKEADRYLKRIKRTNEQIRRAVKKAQESEMGTS
jgi:hypothetical protein